jgi:hypothetical protein
MKTFALIFILTFSAACSAQDWNSSPNNWENSPSNWENSPNNWKNNPNNWDNNPNRWGNERVIRDNDGNPAGYVVPKNNGGANFYDNDGNRSNYLPAR